MIFVYLLLLVPLSLVLAHVVHAPPVWIFVSATLAIVPLAEWNRRATEQLATRTGASIGGLVNVTFSNMTEMILAIFVLMSGNTDVVKAQITGSIIGNGLLGLGLAVLAGSWGRARQSFETRRAGLLSSLLILSMTALLLPAFFDYTERGVMATEDPRDADERLSLGVSVVLIAVYAANLLYTLVTHRDVFAIDEGHSEPGWPLWKSLAILLGGTALTAWEADLISEALIPTAERVGVSPFFLGITLLAMVGNAAEYATAIYFARKDQMDLVMSLTVGSTIQVALLVAPLLVVISYLLGHPMDLVFANPLELIAIVAVAFVINSIAGDGETTWFEGFLLVAVYVLLALAFFFLTPQTR
jgi:Ca2+:H+ antiporter